MRVCMWPWPLLSVPQKEVSTLGGKKKMRVCMWLGPLLSVPQKEVSTLGGKKNAVLYATGTERGVRLGTLKTYSLYVAGTKT